jgi:hypothetical protein
MLMFTFLLMFVLVFVLMFMYQNKRQLLFLPDNCA